ncbi:MAG: hypothetical protein GW809_08675 [Bacteroidetes bacterium]|nr:hypothetical protein [Bacteroidota bacterium]NCQ12195.1 hypothetical protein [Bacteroidota bacterium]
MIKKYIINVVVLIAIFSISHSSILSDKYFIISITILLLLKFMIIGKSLDVNFIFIIFAWYLINILAVILNGGGSVPYVRISSNAMVFFLFPYLILKIYGIRFWNTFEKWIYILTLISLPLFFLNFLFPTFFNSLYPIFHTFTNKTFQYPYWSAIVYVNAMVDGSLIRNSGFMWESGSFAMMIIFAMIYNWITQSDKLNWRFVIYTVALATTFSTAGYLAIVFLFMGKFIKKLSVFNVIVILVFGYLFINIVYKQDFMGNKIKEYISTFNDNELHYDEGYGLIKVNRLQGGYYSIIETLKYPLGYGVISNKDLTDEVEIYGTNGLGSMLKIWGIIGFVYILILLKRFIFFNSLDKIKDRLGISMFIALLIMFFSNPIARDSFIYFILLTPLLYKKNTFNTLNLR